MEVLIAILIIAVLIMLSAFFSGGELALMSLDLVSLEDRANSGDRIAQMQLTMRRRPQRTLGTILIGNNIVNIIAPTFATLTAQKHLAPLQGIGEHATLISTVAMIVLVTIFGELVPKTFAAVRGQRVAKLVTPPLYILDMLLLPANWLLEALLSPLIRWLTGGRTNVEQRIGPGELRAVLTAAMAGGHVNKQDVAIAREAIQMSHRDLEDVMTPRVEIEALPVTATVGEAMHLMDSTGHSRIPLYEESVDNITGVLILKDLVHVSLRAAVGGLDPGDRWASEPAVTYRREVLHYPGTKGILETMSEMNRNRVHLVVVVDEHGGTDGIATLEDIIEELIGDIRDETDTEHHADIVRIGEGFMLITGRARIDSIDMLDGVDASELDSNSVGGLMMEKLDRAVVAGDVLELPGLKLTALKVIGNTVKLIRVEEVPEEVGSGE
ncbi:HlyC/CorC family transporter [bacterium]|nr:HlyC/CorC family transporter [bacterium]